MNRYPYFSEEFIRIRFSDVVVRPIHAGERGEWDRLMSAHHYLGFQSLVGESLRYVAEVPERWLALLGWSAAAFKCRPRDAWIGWVPAVQWQRLSLIVNNARFLILPGIRIPNLASKVLSLNVKRVSDDWDRVHGHPVFLAETFVDTARFTGACYKAANWQYLGHTRGYRKNARGYTHHGQSKAIFVLPLNKDARERLSDPIPTEARGSSPQYLADRPGCVRRGMWVPGATQRLPTGRRSVPRKCWNVCGAARRGTATFLPANRPFGGIYRESMRTRWMRPSLPGCAGKLRDRPAASTARPSGAPAVQTGARCISCLPFSTRNA